MCASLPGLGTNADMVGLPLNLYCKEPKKVKSEAPTQLESHVHQRASRKGSPVRRGPKPSAEGLMERKVTNTAEGQENLNDWEQMHVPGDEFSKQK